MKKAVVLLAIVSFFISCNKNDPSLKNNSAAYIFSQEPNEAFNCLNFDEDGNVLAVNQVFGLTMDKLELWKIDREGNIVWKHITDSTRGISFVNSLKMDDGGFVYCYTANNLGYVLKRLDKTGNLIWVETKYDNYTFPMKLYLKDNQIFVGMTDLPGDHTMFRSKVDRYDLGGTQVDSIQMQQDTFPPGLPGKINNSLGGISSFGNGYAYLVYYGQQGGAFIDQMVTCFTDERGKLIKYSIIKARFNFFYWTGNLLPTPDGGILCLDKSPVNSPLPFPNNKSCVFKLNANADSLWLHYYANADASIYTIVPSRDNGFYLCGSCGNIEHSEIPQAYLAKIDNDGNVLWEQHFIGWLNTTINDVKEAPDGTIACVGNTYKAAKGKSLSNSVLFFLKPDGSYR